MLPGYDLMGLVIGSEGQLGIVTEATVRILRAPEGARPMLLGFDSSEAAGQCVAAIIGAGIIPVAIEFMDRPAIQVCEAFAKAGYPLDVEALLIIEVEGSNEEIADLLNVIARHRQAASPRRCCASARARSRAPRSGRAARRRSAPSAASPTTTAWTASSRSASSARCWSPSRHICDKHGLQVANIFHAGDGNLHPLVLYDANDAAQAERAEQAGDEILELCVALGGCLTGEHGVGIEKRDLMRVQFTADRPRRCRCGSRRVFDPEVAAQPGQGLSRSRAATRR